MKPVPSELPGILFVDDEVNLRKSLERLFRLEPVTTHLASSAEEALRILERERIQVVVSDQRMRGMTGAELLAEVRERHPDVVRVMLTGYTEIDVAVAAINRGQIFRLITKPWNDEELRATVRQAMETYQMRREIERLDRITREQNLRLQEMNQSLEVLAASQTAQLQAKHAELRLAYINTVRALAEAIEAKDPYTRGHSERVGVYSSRIARELNCDRHFIERIYLAGLLHDVGKIGISDAIIGKPSRLTPEEYEEIKHHPEIGARILEPVSFLSDIVECVRHHHEWYDGCPRGYPDRLAGARIPFPSRIILVADTVEAMTSDRPYRKAVDLEVVTEEIRRFSGTQFDPVCADAFLTLIEREEEDFIERASKFDIEEFVSEISPA